jgi:two-component system OmpR family sensor kinase
MKNISITAFINTIFVIAFLAILTTFYLFIKWDRERYVIYEKQRYTMIADSFLSGLQFYPTQKQLQGLFSYFNVAPVIKNRDKLDIINNAKLLYMKESSFGRVRIFVTPRAKYIYVQNFGYHLMLKDLKPKKYNQEIALFLLALISAVIAFLYVIIMKKLMPLKRLDAQVTEFAKGNLDVEIDCQGNDEIGKIAKSFQEAIISIKRLINSKNLFMRNMMHELKTPIAKGRIIAESMEDVEDKEILIRAFERMNEIITNLAQIEKITSSNISPNLQEVKFSDLIFYAKELLLDRDEHIIEEYEDFIVVCDKKLMAIALKNLIDNGIKFSYDNKVTIKADPKKIEIISNSSKLKHPLSYYVEPFSQGEKRDKGFGLGLYIVQSIVDLHHFTLSYRYENNQSIFTITHQLQS